MICSMILVLMWSLVHDFLEDLWESGHWQLIRLRCGVSVLRAFLKLLKMIHRHHLRPQPGLSLNGIISNELLCIVKLCLPLSNMPLIQSFIWRCSI